MSIEETQSLGILILTAAGFGIGHTIIAPDHYLPFAAIAKSRGWSLGKALFVTFSCGLGHLVSSLAVAGLAIALGAGLGSIESIDHFREDIAKWIFLSFAAVYTVFGFKRALFPKRHADGSIHAHSHCHCTAAGGGLNGGNGATFGALFLIFALGPCDILLPLVIYPAVSLDWWGVVAIALVFSAVTVGAMVAMVAMLLFGLKFVPFKSETLQQWGGVITGAILLLCAALMFLGHEH